MNVEPTLGEAILDSELRDINFFNGRLLSAEDLTAEQTVGRARARLLGEALGSGVAFGLEVSPAQSAPAGQVDVQIKAGVAVNRQGQVLRLECDLTLTLVAPPDAASTADCVFSDCSPLPAGSGLSDDGFFLLTIAPASERDGLAPVSGLGNGIAPCNSRYLAEGVQFRLVPLTLSIADDDRLRNKAAYQCFGIPARSTGQFLDDALQAADAAKYGWEALAVAGRLTDQDVPLALVAWTASGGLSFIDRWSVRRRVTQPGAAQSWGYFTEDRRRAEAEAMFYQFQEQIAAVQQQSSNLPNLAAEKLFQYLPPAGLLPVGTNAFAWDIFLGAHAPTDAIPLNLDQARAVVWSSLREEPVTVVPLSAKATAQPPPVPFHVYSLVGRTDVVLFARATPDEVVAADVYYDNSACNMPGVQTVQDALDALCRDRCGCCTLVATPGNGWEKVFDQIPERGDASVCFPIGDYPLANAVKIANRGNLRLTGSGPGSRILANQSEAALIFQNCAGVGITQLAAQTGRAGNKGSALDNLNGTLTFLDCTWVQVEECSLRCAPAGATAATCITVRNKPPTTANAPVTEARLRRCELAVGGEQLGVLLVNVARAQVEDNVMRADGKAAIFQLERGGVRWQAMKRQLVYGVAAGKAHRKQTGAGVMASVTYNQQTVSFMTDASFVHANAADNDWQTAVDALRPGGMTTPDQLKEYVLNLADEALAGKSEVAKSLSLTFGRYIKGLGRQAPVVAFGGIWVAGTIAPEVRILNNTIDGVLAGIHVGLSHREKAGQGQPDAAGFVAIAGNSVNVRLPMGVESQRHGIFVGNVDSLAIENNYLECTRASKADRIMIEGIRIYGWFGRRILVNGNHITGFDIGINFNPLNALHFRKTEEAPATVLLWIITGNLADGALEPAVRAPDALPPSVRIDENYT